MQKRSSAPARIAAVLALILALILAIAVVGGAFDSGGSDSGDRGGSGSGQNAERPKRKVPAVYVIKSGDTLIGIAHRVGVSVARIEALNPDVDPQILGAGEELKLR